MKLFTIRFVVVIILFLSFTISARTIDKAKHLVFQQKKDGSGAPPLLDKNLGGISGFSAKLFDREILNLTSPVHFPYQKQDAYYRESCPIVIPGNQILMTWTSNDTVYCARSNDGGYSWGAPFVISQGIGHAANYLTALRTNTGRIIIVWQAGFNHGLQISYSDDQGLNWSTPDFISSNYHDRCNSLTQSLDGKLWLFYYRYSNSSPTLSDIYYRTSMDNGITWSVEQTFLATSFDELYGTVVSGNVSTLLAIYEDNSSGNYDIYLKYSNDGGATWSVPSPVASDTLDKFCPSVLRQSDGTLWLIYQLYKPTPTLPGFYQNDLYYTRSFDGGNSWSVPVEFTRFVGYDGLHNADLLNNQPFVSWASGRWGSYFYQTQLWYGIIGITQDNNPPPALLNYNNSTAIPRQNVLVPIQAYVDDETGISYVQIFYYLNGVPFGPYQMYDDGLHNDEDPGDNIWGTSIGPFQLGDFVGFAFSITDVTANTFNIQAGSFEIIPVHDVGNVILSFHENSRLAEEGWPPGTSAYWPQENGQDYLFLGSLWIGSEVAGEYRVMNYDYYEEDWSQTAGTPLTLAPGISDQDGNVTYDDQYPWSPPIGIQVHQQSYQWSDTTRYDFIIFKYIVKNTGLSGNLNNLFIAPWLDPDVGNASDDLGGYDSGRGMTYMFDSQGSPSGYIGLKLLGAGNIPHTACIYKIGGDPQTDLERYQAITNGIVPVPTDSADYRMLLTAQPFSLAVGDSQTVAFGLVMGNSLADLQANADTMEAVYHNYLVGIEETVSGKIPTNYFLGQNYPNPFNPSTHFQFGLPRASDVKVEVDNLLGQRVAVLLNERKPAGIHTVNFNGSHLSSGIYLYRIQAGEFQQSRKMLLVK